MGPCLSQPAINDGNGGAIWRALERAGRANGLRVAFAGPLAAIELFVHLEPDQNQQMDSLVAIAATLPASESAQQLEAESLPPEGWKNDFEPLRAIGGRWIRERASLAIEVASAALRPEWNVPVNPLHAAAAQIHVGQPQPSVFEARIFR
ncbi:MAG: RES family NAD+ phosphorylase [Terracidiphilus sp.]